MSPTPAHAAIATPVRTTRPASPAPRHRNEGLVGRLNLEWEGLRRSARARASVTSWAGRFGALAGCSTLQHIEDRVTRSDRATADGILLALIRLGQSGDALATRTVVQLMLGKAVKIAARHAGRASRADLEHSAVTALWTVITHYPVDRRPVKVAANIAMDTLHQTTTELAHQRHEIITDPHVLHVAIPERGDTDEGPADLELLNVLAWAVDGGVVSASDATLIMDVYVPAPGEPGGPAAADRHGLTWAAARQRASRAIRRIADAVRTNLCAPGEHRLH